MSTERAMGSQSLVVCVNGEYVPKDQARISIFDFGFLRGDAVFDTSSAWNGRIFELPAYLERLALSLRAARSRARFPRTSFAASSLRRRHNDGGSVMRPAPEIAPMYLRWPGRTTSRRSWVAAFKNG